MKFKVKSFVQGIKYYSGIMHSFRCQYLAVTATYFKRLPYDKIIKHQKHL